MLKFESKQKTMIRTLLYKRTDSPSNETHQLYPSLARRRRKTGKISKLIYPINSARPSNKIDDNERETFGYRDRQNPFGMKNSPTSVHSSFNRFHPGPPGWRPIS